MLSSIPWAIPFGEGEIRTMLNQAKDVLAWYDGMKNPVPSWYGDYRQEPASRISSTAFSGR
jgi:hypothetical protein